MSEAERSRDRLLDPWLSRVFGWGSIVFLAVLALTKPLGAFMARVFEGERTWLHPVLRPLERLIETWDSPSD